MDTEDSALLGGYGEFMLAQSEPKLISAGDSQGYLYFVISGLLHVSISVTGREKLVARVEAGRNNIDQFIKVYPEGKASLLAGIIAIMSRRIRHMNDKIADCEGVDILATFW